jgi:hypothetical protein
LDKPQQIGVFPKMQAVKRTSAVAPSNCEQADIGSRNARGRELATIQESLARDVFVAVITIFWDPAAKC